MDVTAVKVTPVVLHGTESQRIRAFSVPTSSLSMETGTIWVGVWGLGFWCKFRVEVFGVGAWGLECRGQGLGFRD